MWLLECRAWDWNAQTEPALLGSPWQEERLHVRSDLEEGRILNAQRNSSTRRISEGYSRRRAGRAMVERSRRFKRCRSRAHLFRMPCCGWWILCWLGGPLAETTNIWKAPKEHQTLPTMRMTTGHRWLALPSKELALKHLDTAARRLSRKGGLSPRL